MTFEQLKKACENNDYILVRTWVGVLIGFNCKAANMSIKKHNPKMNKVSNFCGYKPCSFNEYITNKTPFI